MNDMDVGLSLKSSLIKKRLKHQCHNLLFMHVIFVTRANFRYENFIQVGEIKNPQIEIYYMAQLPHVSASQKG